MKTRDVILGSGEAVKRLSSENARLRTEVERYKTLEQAAQAVVAVWMYGGLGLADRIDALEYVLNAALPAAADPATEDDRCRHGYRLPHLCPVCGHGEPDPATEGGTE